MITCHCLENGTLARRPVTGPTLPPNALWIDLLSPTADEERLVERSLQLDIPTPEETAEIEDSSRFYSRDEALYMTATVVSGVDQRAPSAVQVTFLLMPRCLVTVRYCELTPFRLFYTKLQRQPGLHTTSETLFAALLDAIIDRVADVLEELQVLLNRLSATVFDKGEQRTDLLQVIKQLGQHRTLLAQLGESLFSCNRLIAYYRLHGPEARKSWLKALERDVRSLGEHQAKQASDINFLLDATLGLINIEQNSIIKVFSIAAVLFLPPTLVGTVYGMNFEHMPELSWAFGYPMALVMMVISAVIPYVWFKARDWL